MGFLNYQPVELTFGTSGLRGLVADMTDLECYINTLGFLKYVESLGQLSGKVYIAGDLRSSTPRILAAVAHAISDMGQEVVNCGFIPTPALAYYAQLQTSPCVMVTGSHIPDDRNGIKFYRVDGEILKEDELSIKQHVGQVRERLYVDGAASFSPEGASLSPAALTEVDDAAARAYIARFTDVFASDLLRDQLVVVYQHSAVGRDLYVEVLEALGATVEAVGWSEKFIPIDTENVTLEDQKYFEQLAQQFPNALAIVSSDGDSDRPFLIDETGYFHRGDELGLLVATALHADAAAVPISSSDAVEQHLAAENVPLALTRIGSPYVIAAMKEATQAGARRVVGWEVNGGFMTGSSIDIDGKTLQPLATRDALLPILVALWRSRVSGVKVSECFAQFPKRFTQAGLIDNFAVEVSQKLIEQFSDDNEENRSALMGVFSQELGFGKLVRINSLDGVRMYFDNDEIAHIRPSGNAPQLRIYSVSKSQERADEIVRQGLVEPEGTLRCLEQLVL